MTAAAVASAPPRIVASGKGFGNAALAVLVFLGGFVIIEPAPYELLLVPIMGAWLIFGLRISRYVLPLVILLFAYLIGGILALSQVPDLGKPMIYFLTTALLAVSAIFFAAVIPSDPERRLDVIIKAYVAGAVAAATVGILGYFLGIEFFTLYQRARGPFQDPNVFGPFLVLPFTFLAYRILTSRFRDSLGALAGALVILVAIFLSFSRGAWAMAAVALAITGGAAFINQRRPGKRLRVVLYGALGIGVVVAMIGIALMLPATSGLFEERAQLVQYYDGGEGGRFDRHIQGFLLVLEKPLGLGPFGFGHIFREDEHEMWLKGFTVYGWLGGFAYIALAIWTLIVSFPLMFRPRPWQPLAVTAFATLVGQFVLHFVIDNDHWRHLFLLYGVLWGIYAAERLHQRRLRLRPAAIPASVPVFHATVPRAAI